MKFVPWWGPSLAPVACQLNVVVDDGGGLSGACIICTISICVSWGWGWGLVGLLCYVSMGLPVPSISSRVCIGEMEGTKALSDCCVGFSQTACLQAVCRCYQHCQSLCIVENGMLRPFLTVGFSQDCISPLSMQPLPTRSVLWRWVVLCSILSFCFCKNICVLQQMSN